VAATTDAPSTPVAQFLWVLMALGLLLAILLAASGNVPAALACGLLAAGAAVVALIINLLKSAPPAPSEVTGPFGAGPHATHSGTPDAARVAELCQMAQQLRDAAKDEHWTLDWTKFNAFGERAQAALVAGKYDTAVREYALAISFMMNEIRHQPSRKDPRDSSVLDL
jgi:hypothetical protein